MLPRIAWFVCSLIVVPTFLAARIPTTLTFEETVQTSDRVVLATILGHEGGTETLRNGTIVTLGFKDPITNHVFTRFRVDITECVFDNDASCTSGQSEILIPGGTIWETIDGKPRLRTWEITGATGALLPQPGDELVLFMAKLANGEYQPLNDGGARLRIDRVSGMPQVHLRFASPRLLSRNGRAAAQERLARQDPTKTRPEFTETVPVHRLKELIKAVRASRNAAR